MPSPKTVADLLLHRLESSPDRLAFSYPVEGGDHVALTWRQTGHRVRVIANGLAALGLENEQCCALVSGTRIEWILADLAVLCAGGATTTVYPSSPIADCGFILGDAGCVLAFVENIEQLAKVQEHRSALPKLRKVILFEGDSESDDWVMSLAELERLGQERSHRHPEEFERLARAVRPEQLATIIYTSGTTGRPKGVRLTHDGWVYQSEVAETVKLFTPDDHQLLWLPLSHAFGKVLEVCALRVGFATTVDGRVPQLMDNLARVRPTFMGAPPRIFEKIYSQLMLAMEESSGLKRALLTWAFDVGRAVSRVRQTGREPTGLLALKLKVADRLVFSKVRLRFGGRMRFMFSGSAPLPRDLAEFFHAAGLLILEGYGLTETSGGAVLNSPDAFAFGSVGKPNPGTELRIADDGEILLKSRGMMQAYQNLPEETRVAVTRDGWLRTGDIGEIDAQGFLRITDRKKDLIKTSNGQYVAPQKVEALLKAHCPYVGQVVVHGDKRGYCSALIALDADAIRRWAKETGPGDLPYAELAKHPDVRALIEPAIEKVNATLSSHESIRKFVLLSEELTIENGLLTPSMKLRRKLAEQRYAATLESLYENASAP
ncbi:MAG TPA: long-chain fatty acid--CoA ligase [Polyangiaceae bacterium]|nr:long-chain fatty acid--CoA ligase [Polyangiaceae bacterium]